MKPQIEKIVTELSKWVAGVRENIDLDGAYVFGSLVRNNGAQFDVGMSLEGNFDW